MSAPKDRLVIVTGGSSGRAGPSLSLAVTCSAQAGLQRRIEHVQPVAEAASVELGADPALEDFDNADADRFRGMAIGTWLDFVDKDGKVQAGKLSWVSPISSRLLFVNRRGVRFCVASPEELAVMVRLGRLRAHVNDGAFDSAMQGVIDRLDPQTSTVH